jgi:hypothetical protein
MNTSGGSDWLDRLLDSRTHGHEGGNDFVQDHFAHLFQHVLHHV